MVVGTTQLSLVIGGKPLLLSFSIPITFELTILLSALDQSDRDVREERDASLYHPVAPYQMAHRATGDRSSGDRSERPKFNAVVTAEIKGCWSRQCGGRDRMRMKR